MKSRPFSLVAATAAALLSFSHDVRGQGQSAIDPAALKVLDSAFTYFQDTPIQFTSANSIVQEMGERRNQMLITQKITSSPAGFAVVGTSPDFPAPVVHIAGGTASVIFENEKSYIQLSGLDGLTGAYQSADLGYDATVGENSLLGATPGAAMFEKLLGADSEGRKAFFTELKIAGEKVISGIAGDQLLGIMRANPIGLPIDNALVPFEMVIAKGDSPMLLSYVPDTGPMVAEFSKDRPQLGALKVTMNCTFTDWKTGADIDGAALKLPDLAGFKKYNTFGELAAAMQQQGGAGAPDATELEGKPAPDFELATSEGGTFKLSDEKGKSVVILDFWATWCGPCVQAMPIIDRVAKAYAAKGVKLVAVNLAETVPEVKAFMEQHKLAPLVAMDTEGATAEKYLVSGIPQTVIIAKDGTVSKVHIGLLPDLEKQLNAEVKALVEK